MLRTAFFLTGLVGLLATAAVAAPTENTTTNWRGWGLRHRRPSQADFVPVYATYRYHSRERHGLFGFLHKSNPTARHLGKKPKPLSHPAGSRKHTTGRF
ncbi:MAG: hypothetical protein ACRYFZ_25615 [Janthinobacterium lividum]